MSTPAHPTPACSPSCPCQWPKAEAHSFGGGDTRTRFVVVETVPDLRGVTLDERRLARSRFFKYEVRA